MARGGGAGGGGGEGGEKYIHEDALKLSTYGIPEQLVESYAKRFVTCVLCLRLVSGTGVFSELRCFVRWPLARTMQQHRARHINALK